MFLKLDNPEFTWDETLLPYLASSNEDEVVVSAFERSVAPILNAESQHIWLEVGPGPASKSLGIASSLGAHNIGSRPIFLEPSELWRKYLASEEIGTTIKRRLGHNLILCSDTMMTANYDRLLARRANLLVTCTHVIYDDEATRGIQRLASFIEDRIEPTLLFLVLESEVSDFHVLRRLLSAEGFSVPEARRRGLHDLIIDMGWGASTTTSSVAKTCRVEKEDLSRWFLPFLLGIPKGQYELMAESDRNHAESVVENFVKSRASASLRVSDDVTVVRLRD
jgi:hypothetical protein